MTNKLKQTLLQSRKGISWVGIRVLRRLLSVAAVKTVRDLVELSPKLRVPRRIFILPLALTLLAVACDGAALALLGPVFQRIIEDGTAVADQSAEANRVARVVMFLLGLEDNPSLLSLVFLVLFLSIIAIPLRRLGTLLVGVTIKNVNSELQPALISRILQFGKLYFQVSDLSTIHELRNQASAFVTGGIRLVHRAVESIAFIAFYLCIMFSISFSLSLYFVVAGACMGILTLGFRKKIEQLTAEGVGLSQLLRHQVATCFQGIEIIKGNALEQPAVERVHERAQAKKAHGLRVLVLDTAASVFQDIFGLLIVFVAVALYVYSAPELSAGVASNAAVFLLLARRILTPISNLNACFLDGAKITPGLAALQTILCLDDKFIPYTGCEDIPEELPEITITNLSFCYPDGFVALEDVSMRIPPSGTIAIVGKSGAGKTTLMKLLLKLYEAPPNTIYVGATDIRELDRLPWCKSLSYIPQNPRLFTGTLRENLVFSVEGEVSDERLIAVLKEVHLGYLLRVIKDGLDGMIGEEGARLSRGEQQRISIARAILQDSQLVLIDEATASLDVRTEHKMMKTITKFCQGRTAVIIAHRLSTIRHADVIFVLDEGKVVEQGSFDQLLAANGLFAEFWSLHTETEIGFVVPEALSSHTSSL